MSSQEKIVVVTGASSGIGKAAAVRFASAGHRVIMACRDAGRGERARSELVQLAAGGTVEVRELDVSSFESVRQFSAGFCRDYGRLDVLIHNAGYFSHGLRTYQRSVDGLELTFATNVFGPFLLTELLLDVLSRSGDARVLTAGSTNLKNFFDPARAIEFDNLRGEAADTRSYSNYKMYGDSKMGLLLLTQAMAEAYRDRSIAVNCVMIPTVRMEKERLGQFHSIFRVVGPLLNYWNPFALDRAQMAEVYHRICTDESFRFAR